MIYNIREGEMRDEREERENERGKRVEKREGRGERKEMGERNVAVQLFWFLNDVILYGAVFVFRKEDSNDLFFNG